MRGSHSKPSLLPLSAAALLGGLLLAGCPEPVVENPGDPDGIDEGASTRGVMGEGPAEAPADAPPMQATATAPPGGAGVMPDADLEPVYSQSELSDGAVLKGTLGCENCAGKLLVRVLPPPPDQGGDEEEGIVLITQKAFDGPGPFEIRVPEDRKKVVLQVVEDADGSGKPSTGERMGLVLGGPITVDGEVEGISLTVGVFPEGMTPAGAPPGGTPAGPPNPGGPEAAPAGDAITSGLPPATGVPGDSPPPALDAAQPGQGGQNAGGGQ